MEDQSWTTVGRGLPTWKDGAAEGVIADVRAPADVLELLSADLSDVIVLMHTAGATMLTPIFADLAGIVCTTGNIGSHVAIISRESGIPCIVAAELDTEDIVGRRVRMEPDGSVSALPA